MFSEIIKPPLKIPQASDVAISNLYTYIQVFVTMFFFIDVQDKIRKHLSIEKYTLLAFEIPIKLKKKCYAKVSKSFSAVTVEVGGAACRWRGGDMTNGGARSKFKIRRVTPALMALFMEAF